MSASTGSRTIDSLSAFGYLGLSPGIYNARITSCRTLCDVNIYIYICVCVCVCVSRIYYIYPWVGLDRINLTDLPLCDF